MLAVIKASSISSQKTLWGSWSWSTEVYCEISNEADLHPRLLPRSWKLSIDFRVPKPSCHTDRHCGVCLVDLWVSVKCFLLCCLPITSYLNFGSPHEIPFLLELLSSYLYFQCPMRSLPLTLCLLLVETEMWRGQLRGWWPDSWIWWRSLLWFRNYRPILDSTALFMGRLSSYLYSVCSKVYPSSYYESYLV